MTKLNTQATYKNGEVSIANLDVVQDLYFFLSQSVDIPICGPEEKFTEGQLEFETNAGVFILDKNEAEKLYSTLQGWDREDSATQLEDGLISEATWRATCDAQQRKGDFKHVGLTLSFREFKPNELWRDNYSTLHKIQDDRYLLSHLDAKDGDITPDSLWEATTTATLSGYTPEIFNKASNLCSVTASCLLFYGIHDPGSMWAKSSPVKESPSKFRIRVNLSTSTSKPHIRYIVSHEHSHRLFKAIAKENDQDKFAGVILSEAEKDRNYRQAVADYRASYNEKDRGKKFQYAYIIEEMADSGFFMAIDPSLVAVQRDQWMYYRGPELAMSQVDYNKYMNTTYDSWWIKALYLALWVHRGRACKGAQKVIDALDAKNRECLKTHGEKAIKLYEATLKLGEFILKYCQSSPFKDSIKRHISPSLLAAMRQK